MDDFGIYTFDLYEEGYNFRIGTNKADSMVVAYFWYMDRILAALFAVAASGASVDECSGSFFIYNPL
jgi:hypothetical protein